MSNDKANLSQFLLSDVSTLYGGVHRYLEAINRGDKSGMVYIRELTELKLRCVETELKLLAEMEEQNV